MMRNILPAIAHTYPVGLQGVEPRWPEGSRFTAGPGPVPVYSPETERATRGLPGVAPFEVLCFRRYSKGALPLGFSTRAWVGRRWLEPKPAPRSRQNTAYEPADQGRPWWPAGLLVRVMFAVCRIVVPEVEGLCPSV